jgi:uncharacterized protein YndB with AHSA1/START domain
MQVKKEKSSIPGKEMGISRLINAPRELVWKAWTDPEHIRHWWGPSGFTNSISKMELMEGGEWEFIMHGPDGTDYRNKHIYREIKKPEKLVLEHTTAPHFVMTVTFEAQGNKTLVTLHSVFDSEDQLQEVIKVFKADVGMKQNVDRMEEYITHMPVIFERVYNASSDKIWKALTDREEMEKWYFKIAAFKAEPGAEFSFTGQGHKGEQYLHLCEVKEVIPGKKLSYSWKYEGIPGESLVTFELFPEGDRTKLKLTHSGVESFPQDNPDFAKESFTGGWDYITGTSLKNYLEKT